MNFKKNPDDEDINKNIQKVFTNQICEVDDLKASGTMEGIKNLYCDTDINDSTFSEFIISYKLLYTSSYSYNIRILETLSRFLNNSYEAPKEPFNIMFHKALMLGLFLIIYWLYKLNTSINKIFINLFKMKKNNNPKKKKKKKKKK